MKNKEKFYLICKKEYIENDRIVFDTGCTYLFYLNNVILDDDFRLCRGISANSPLPIQFVVSEKEYGYLTGVYEYFYTVEEARKLKIKYIIDGEI